MAQKIKNMRQLAKLLEPKITKILELVAKDVKKEIDEALEKYYNEYDPAVKGSLSSWFYQRTEQLKNCCKIGQARVSSNVVSVEIYLDIDSLNYETDGADPFKTVVSANAGLHGGWDTDNLSNGQMPWDTISGNDGTAYGNGTQIWEEPMKEFIERGKLVILFKKYTKQRGLNIK